MSTIGLFYGTDTGNTEIIVDKLIDEFAQYNIMIDTFDILNQPIEEFANYEHIILAQPTWYYGELQSSWEDFWQTYKTIDFRGKKIACFGLGDQYDYSEYYVDAMGLMHDIAVKNGATAYGYISVEGFEFDASKALTKDRTQFVGLALDEDQQPELTDERIKNWVAQLVHEFGFNN